nr:hypothetical protein [Tanacetum cinerariifolium]
EIGEEEQVESLWVEKVEKGGIIAELDADEDVTLEEVAAEVEKDAKVAKKDNDELELAEIKEVIKVVSTGKLMTEVVIAAATTISVALSAARIRNGVVIRDPKETATPLIIVHSELKSKDKGKRIIVEEPKPLKKQAQIEQDKAYAREEDLEMLWKIVQERFASSKPKNFSDDFLLNTLKVMFEKPDVEAYIWKNQRGNYGLAKVKSWKLLAFGVDVVRDFKEYMLRDYYCWLKTYCCWYKLKLLNNAADSRLRLLKESVAADEKMKE